MYQIQITFNVNTSKPVEYMDCQSTLWRIGDIVQLFCITCSVFIVKVGEKVLRVTVPLLVCIAYNLNQREEGEGEGGEGVEAKTSRYILLIQYSMRGVIWGEGAL